MEVGIALSNRPIDDAEWTGRQKPESLVVPRITEQRHQWPALALGLAQEFGHQGTADALAVPRRGDGEGSDGHHGPTVEISPRAEDMPHDHATVIRDQLEPDHAGVEPPGCLDDLDLLESVPRLISERISHDPQDGRGIARFCGPDRPRHDGTVARPALQGQ